MQYSDNDDVKGDTSPVEDAAITAAYSQSQTSAL